MNRKTHVVFAIALLSYTDVFSRVEFPLYAVIAAFISILPDMDLKYKHRKLLHNVFVPLMLSLLLYALYSTIQLQLDSQYFIYVNKAVWIGWLSHLFLDILTMKGVYLFYPLLDIGISLKLCHSNSVFWNTLAIVLSLIAITWRYVNTMLSI